MKKITDYKAHLDSLWAKHLSPKTDKTVISLFSGCGGSSLGYSVSGFKELAVVEYDKTVHPWFTANFKDVPVISKDIRAVSVDDVLKTANIKEGDLTVLDMSPVCCGFSTAGKMIIDDERNFLFKEGIRILRGLMPKSFVMENVPNIASKRFSHIFSQITDEFKNSGYTINYKILNSCFYGTATSRKRIFIVGIRNDLNLSYSFPEPVYEPVPFKDAVLDITNDAPTRPLSTLYLSYWNTAGIGKPIGKRNTELKIDPEKPCVTLICSLKYHPTEPRGLSVREMARVQGFPDEFILPDNQNKACFVIGNSVCPPIMHEISKELDKILI